MEGTQTLWECSDSWLNANYLLGLPYAEFWQSLSRALRRRKWQCRMYTVSAGCSLGYHWSNAWTCLPYLPIVLVYLLQAGECIQFYQMLQVVPSLSQRLGVRGYPSRYKISPLIQPHTTMTGWAEKTIIWCEVIISLAIRQMSSFVYRVYTT